MALYRPTNITPSSFSGLGNGTVDVTQDLVVSWQVEGASAMTAYQIVIQQNDTDSTQVYDSGQVNLDTPFFGTDYQGNIQRFSATIAASELTGLTNGYENGYKMVITQWWSSEDSVQQIQPSYFITRAEPTLTLDEVTTPLQVRKYLFSAKYEQAQGDSLYWFRWYLANSGEEDTPFKDTGNIYGTEDIRFSYDGFITGQSYSIRCVCETENGVTADTGWVEISVSYSLSLLNGVVQGCRVPGIEDAVLVAWPAIQYIPGEADGTYTVENGAINLPLGSSVTWDQVNGNAMNLNPPWSVAFKINITGNSGTPLTLNGASNALSVSYTSAGFTVTLNGTAAYVLNTYVAVGDVWIVVITPSAVYFRLDCIENGLFPAETLYPAEDLYPEAGAISTFQFTENWTPTLFAITGITLAGPGVFSYLWILSGTFSTSQMQNLLYSYGYEPEYDSSTIFLANFEEGLDAGNLQSPGETLVGVALYRLLNGSTQLQHIADLPLTTTQILDYGFANQSQFQYYLFPQGEDTYISQPLVSPMLQPVFWNWTLLVCVQDETDENIYYMQNAYVFANNVSSGSMSNNSAPNLLKNFTQYPTIQMDTANYKSGTLSALIGRVDQTENQYIDSVELANEIMDLSTDTRPKFLKDRKGNLMQVSISGAVVMTAGDTQPQQCYTVQLPWAEVGSVEDISIIQTPESGMPAIPTQN